MNKRNIIIASAIGGFFLIGIVVTIILLNQKQDIRSRAQVADTSLTPTAAPTTSSCVPPAKVTNVKIDYPNCQ